MRIWVLLTEEHAENGVGAGDVAVPEGADKAGAIVGNRVEIDVPDTGIVSGEDGEPGFGQEVTAKRTGVDIPGFTLKIGCRMVMTVEDDIRFGPEELIQV